MKHLLALAALLGAFAASPAQLVQEDTPPPISSLEWKQTSDGSSLVVLNAWTLHEAYFAIPFGLDFSAGHSVWVGTRTRLDRLTEAQGVFGWEVYGKKALGGDGFFVKMGAGFAFGPRTPDHSAFTPYVFFSGGFGF